MPFGAQPVRKQRLQLISGMVRGNGNAHRRGSRKALRESMSGPLGEADADLAISEVANL